MHSWFILLLLPSAFQLGLENGAMWPISSRDRRFLAKLGADVDVLDREKIPGARYVSVGFCVYGSTRYWFDEMHQAFGTPCLFAEEVRQFRELGFLLCKVDHLYFFKLPRILVSM